MLTLLMSLALAATPVEEVLHIEWERQDAPRLDAFREHGSPEVRAAVLIAAGRMHHAPGVQWSVQALSDPDERVRLAAADALGQHEGGGEGALKAWQGLAEGAGGTHDVVARALLVSIGRRGGPEAIEAMTGALGHTDARTAREAARALGRMGRREVDGIEVAVPRLLNCAGALDPWRSEPCSWALGRIGASSLAPDSAAALMRVAIAQPRPWARHWLVRAAAAGLDDARWLPVLRQALLSDSREVRVGALQGLATRGGDPSVAMPLLGDSDSWVRQAAASAIGDALDSASAEHLRALAADASPEHARHLVMALVAAGYGPGPDDMADPRPRVAAAWLPMAPDHIDAAADSEHAAMRTAAAALLADYPDDGRVTRWLNHADPVLRAAAYEQAFAGGRVLPQRAWRAIVDEANPDVLSQGLDAAQELDAPTQAMAFLGELRAHPEVRLRRLASRWVADSATPRGGPLPTPIDLQAVLAVRGATLRTTAGTLRVSLRPDVAPVAVASFVALAEAHVLDGRVMHRVVPGFVVQGGCPRDDGWGGPGYAMPDERSSLPYEVGVLGMARSGPDTAGSQWFITTSAQPHLTGDYTVMGHVTYGLHAAMHMTEDDVVLDIQIERAP